MVKKQSPIDSIIDKPIKKPSKSQNKPLGYLPSTRINKKVPPSFGNPPIFPKRVRCLWFFSTASRTILEISKIEMQGSGLPTKAEENDWAKIELSEAFSVEVEENTWDDLAAAVGLLHRVLETKLETSEEKDAPDSQASETINKCDSDFP